MPLRVFLKAPVRTGLTRYAPGRRAWLMICRPARAGVSAPLARGVRDRIRAWRAGVRPRRRFVRRPGQWVPIERGEEPRRAMTDSDAVSGRPAPGLLGVATPADFGRNRWGNARPPRRSARRFAPGCRVMVRRVAMAWAPERLALGRHWWCSTR